MKTRLIAALLAAGGLALAAGAQANETDKLKAGNCLACHDLDKKKVGPPLKEAAKKGVKADELVAKMKDGKGHPKVAKPEADLKAAAEQAATIK